MMTTRGIAFALDLGPNLLGNPGAEDGDATVFCVPFWTPTGTPAVLEYGSPIEFPGPHEFPPPRFRTWFPTEDDAGDGGQQFFSGGAVGDSSLTQSVDLSAAAADIDGGGVGYRLAGDLGGSHFDRSSTEVTVYFVDASGTNLLGTGSLQPVTAHDRGFLTQFIDRSLDGTVPVGTRFAEVEVFFHHDKSGSVHYNNAYADNISFQVTAALPAAPPSEWCP